MQMDMIESVTDNKVMGGRQKYRLPHRVPDAEAASWSGEAKKLLRLAIPISLANTLNLLPLFVNSVFAGQLGEKELSALGMAVPFITLTCVSVSFGLASGADTLMTQAWGALLPKKVGRALYQGLVLGSLLAVPTSVLLYASGWIFEAVISDTETASMASRYCRWYILGIPASSAQLLFNSFLYSQGAVVPILLISLLANVVNAGLNYLLLLVLRIGVHGAAISTGVSYWVAVLALSFYSFCSGRLHETWPGSSSKVITSIKRYIKLVVPGTVMVAVESWTFEINTFACSFKGKPIGPAQVIMFNLECITFTIALGLGIATCVRVGNSIGAHHQLKHAKSAKMAATLGICFSAISGVVCGVILAAGHKVIPRLWTDDAEILNTTETSMFFIAAFMIPQCIHIAFNNIIRACGRLKLGAALNFIGYYLVALPIGIPLLFFTDLGLIGLWIGMLIGETLIAVCMGIALYRTDWNQQSLNSRNRLSSVNIEVRKHVPVVAEFATSIANIANILRGSEGNSNETFYQECYKGVSEKL